MNHRETDPNKYIDPRTWATCAVDWFAEEKRLKLQAERDACLLGALRPNWTPEDTLAAKEWGMLL